MISAPNKSRCLRYNVYVIRQNREGRLVKCQHRRLTNFHTRRAAVQRAVKVSGQSPAKTGFERVYVEYDGVKVWDSGRLRYPVPAGWEAIG